MNKMMKKIAVLIVAMVVVATLGAQEAIGVAILKPVDEADNVQIGLKLALRSTLAYAINHMPGYEAYTRVNMAQIMDEQEFQRSGYVSDDQIRKIGVATGAKYVLVAEAAYYDESHITVTASIIDIETTKLKAQADPEISPIDAQGMKKSCISIARSLLGMDGPLAGGNGSGSYQGGSSYQGGGSRGNGGSNASRGQDFTETAYGIDMRMVYVEGGTFMMGCTGDQGGECDGDEKPGRQTTVGSFYIGMLEVTQSQWEKVMGTTIYQQRSKANNSNTYGTGTDYPMYYVSWEEAKEFCARLSRATGRNYSLPTEAEWEYAARGGKRNEGTKYAGGWTVDDVAWYDGNSGNSTHPCGTKRSNALGLYDMSGNVWEWCEDWYGSAYPQYDNNNPKGPGAGSYRVLRGGGWRHGAEFCRVAYRGGNSPGYRSINGGFRVVVH